MVKQGKVEYEKLHNWVLDADGGWNGFKMGLIQFSYCYTRCQSKRIFLPVDEIFQTVDQILSTC